MKKNILKFLITNILILASAFNINTYAADEYEIDGLKYEIFTSSIRNREEARLLKNGPNSTITHIIVPEEVTINGNVYKVTNLSASALANFDSLISVEFSDTLRGMNINIFSGCNALKEVRLSESITTIYSNTFYNCSALESIEIPNSVTSINSSAFYGCSSLEKITIPAAVETIEYEVFGGSGLKDMFFLGAQPTIIGGESGSIVASPIFTIPENTNIYMFNEFANTSTLSTNIYNIKVIDEIDTGSSMSIPFSFSTASPIVFKSDDNSSADLLLDEGVVISAENGINIDLTVTDERFHFFSLPFDCALNDITGGVDSILNIDNYGTEWIIKQFDGSRHALYGKESTDATNNEKYSWVMLQENDILNAGEGYIVAINQVSELIIDGTATFYFPSKDAVSIEYKHSKNSEIPTPLTAVNVTENESTQDAYKGWNLVSTNLLHAASDINITVDNQEVKFVSIPNSDGVSYYQTETTDADFTAYKSFFIQAPAGGELNVNYASASSGYNIKSNNTTVTESRIVISIASAADDFEDKTTILLNDDYTTDYVINQDLRKWSCNNQTQIYSESNETQYSYNALPFSSVINDKIALVVVTPNYTSTHTITLEKFDLASYPNKYLILEDKYTNKKIALSSQITYTFEPNSTKSSDRFEIYLSDSAFTNVDNIEAQKTSLNFYTDNNKIFVTDIVEGGNISLYSISGQLLYKKSDTQTSEVIETSSLSGGNYILQVENKGEVQTAKIVLQ